MLNKRGDLTIRYVILFALALIVLVVITLIFYGSAADFSSKIKELLSNIWSAKPTDLFQTP